MDGWRGVGGRVVLTRVQGTINGWVGPTEESGFGHPVMVGGGIWGRIGRGRGRVPLIGGIPAENHYRTHVTSSHFFDKKHAFVTQVGRFHVHGRLNERANYFLDVS